MHPGRFEKHSKNFIFCISRLGVVLKYTWRTLGGPWADLARGSLELWESPGGPWGIPGGSFGSPWVLPGAPGTLYWIQGGPEPARNEG